MKKLVILAVGAILLLGVVAVVAVLLASGRDDAGSPPAPVQQAGRNGPGPGPLAGAPSGPTEAAPGPRRVQVPRGRLTTDLAEPLAPCFQAFPARSSIPGVLTLELEAQADGRLAILDATVKSWGGAAPGLVDCARNTLRGRLVRAGTFTPGDLATSDYALEPPPSVAPPPRDPPSTGLPANRTQPPRRSGASR